MVFTNGKFVSDRKIAHLLQRHNQVMCDFGAWHWLLSQAAFKERNKNYHGRIITIKRGDIPTTYRKLADAFHWSINRVQRFIKNLQRVEIISTSTDTGFLIVSICNYDEIQSFRYKDNTSNDTRADIEAGTNRTKDNKRNNTGSALPVATQAEPEKGISRWKMLVKKSIGTIQYRSWVESLEYNDGYIFCPNSFVENWCKSNYTKEIEQALNDAGKDFKGFEVDNVVSLKTKVGNRRA